jgi:hypothetical protein
VIMSCSLCCSIWLFSLKYILASKIHVYFSFTSIITKIMVETLIYFKQFI